MRERIGEATGPVALAIVDVAGDGVGGDTFSACGRASRRAPPRRSRASPEQSSRRRAGYAPRGSKKTRPSGAPPALRISTSVRDSRFVRSPRELDSHGSPTLTAVASRGKYAHTASNMQPTHAGIDQLLDGRVRVLAARLTLITSLPSTASWTLHRQPRGATTRWSPPTYTASVPASEREPPPTAAPASAGTSGRRSRPRRGSERSAAWSRLAPLAPDAATASARRPQKADDRNPHAAEPTAATFSGNPTSRPFAIEPTAEIVTCLCQRTATERRQPRKAPRRPAAHRAEAHGDRVNRRRRRCRRGSRAPSKRTSAAAS